MAPPPHPAATCDATHRRQDGRAARGSREAQGPKGPHAFPLTGDRQGWMRNRYGRTTASTQPLPPDSTPGRRLHRHCARTAPSDQTGQCRIIVHEVKPERTADDIGEIGQDHQRACLNFKDVVMPPTVATGSQSLCTSSGTRRTPARPRGWHQVAGANRCNA